VGYPEDGATARAGPRGPQICDGVHTIGISERVADSVRNSAPSTTGESGMGKEGGSSQSISSQHILSKSHDKYKAFHIFTKLSSTEFSTKPPICVDRARLVVRGLSRTPILNVPSRKHAHGHRHIVAQPGDGRLQLFEVASGLGY